MMSGKKNKQNNPAVNSPNHYTKGKIQVWDFIKDQNLPYDEGNVVKYVCRHKDKNGLEDVLKAIEYLKHIALTDYNHKL